MPINFDEFNSKNNQNKSIDNISFIVKPSINSFLNIKDENEKLKMIRKIGDSKDQNFNDILFQILESDNNNQFKNEIFLSLGKLKNPKIFPTLIHLLLNSNDINLRKEIISIFSEFEPTREIISPLEYIILWDRNSEIKKIAIQALGKMGSILSIFTLEKAYEKEQSPILKKEIIWSLYKIEESETKEFLSNQVVKEKNEFVLQEIIWFLVNLKVELQILCDLINDFEKLSYNIQKTLIWTMAQNNEKNYQNELLNLLTNRNLPDNIKNEIIHVCTIYKIKKASNILLKILKFGDLTSKKYALAALATLENKKIIPELSKRLKKEKNHEIRDEIKKTLYYLASYN
jgi:HEAT repeat protein